MLRLGVDVGGTFTDLVLLDESTGEAVIEKILTTSADPSAAILTGVARLKEQGFKVDQIREVIHGTTLVGNAIIVRTGAKVGLLATRGFRDVLHFVGRELKYDIYDPNLVYAEPAVPRHLRRELYERVGGDGEIVEELDVGQARDVVRSLLEEGVEAIAVSLLHAYLTPEHEQTVRDIVREEAPHLPVSLSHEVLPEIREYERTSTTALNAYVQPITREYLRRLRERLRAEGMVGDLYPMTSSGGMITTETAEAFPIQLIESGPAAGALFAAQVGKMIDSPSLVSFDMGGTTAKLCVIKDGKPLITKKHETGRVKRFHKGSGLPIGVPMVDLLEIGAGGGSIAEINELGLVQVGPRSAGSDPGPVCYQLGGREPTVTDANLVLGFLNPDYFLGGEMKLDTDLAASVIEEKIGRLLGMDAYKAAMAINKVVTDSMAEAARVHSVEMNVDIRRFPLVAFGGAGPVHAYGIGQRLKLPAVVLPLAAGVLSAVGLLAAPLAFDFSRSYPRELAELDGDTVRNLFRMIEEQGRELLVRAGVEEIHFERSVDICYVGQGSEVATPVPDRVLEEGDVSLLKDAFDNVYESAYGRRLEELPAKCLTWRILASGPTPKVPTSIDRDKRDKADPLKGTRGAHFPEYGLVTCDVYERSRLSSGDRLLGPALIEERASTAVVPPGAGVSVDDHLNLVLSWTSDELDDNEQLAGWSGTARSAQIVKR